MCAIDALGIAPMLNRTIEISSHDPRSGTPISVQVAPSGDPTWQPQTAVVLSARSCGDCCDRPSYQSSCTLVNFFENTTSARAPISTPTPTSAAGRSRSWKPLAADEPFSATSSHPDLREHTMSRVIDPEGAHSAALHRLVDFRARHVLEMGCGDGRLTREIAPEAASVLAFDPDAEAVARATNSRPADRRRRRSRLAPRRSTLRPRRAHALSERRSPARPLRRHGPQRPKPRHPNSPDAGASLRDRERCRLRRLRLPG